MSSSTAAVLMQTVMQKTQAFYSALQDSTDYISILYKLYAHPFKIKVCGEKTKSLNKRDCPNRTREQKYVRKPVSSNHPLLR